jgi:hypothetical protein
MGYGSCRVSPPKVIFWTLTLDTLTSTHHWNFRHAIRNKLTPILTRVKRPRSLRRRAFWEALTIAEDLGIERPSFLEVRQEPLDFFIFLQPLEALRHVFIGKFLFSVGHGFGVMHPFLHSAER